MKHVHRTPGMLLAMMGSDDATEILDRLAARGIEVWVDGGSGVDALFGEQTRAHDDLDLVIARGDCPAVQDALEPPGFEHATDIEPGLPARLAVRDPGDRRVDIHPVVFDQAGDGWQELPAGSWGQYPADGLGGVGTIAGRPVRCLAPELQVRHHLGYEPDADDHHDMHRLAERFWLELPPPYGSRGLTPSTTPAGGRATTASSSPPTTAARSPTNSPGENGRS